MPGLWVKRSDAALPYQTWKPFDDHAIVQVKNGLGDSSIGPAKDLWWGWERNGAESVIVAARRLDRPK